MTRLALLLVALAGLLGAQCDVRPQPPPAATGGATATGGAPGTGGVAATGGSATGGAPEARCPFVRTRAAAARTADLGRIIGGEPAPAGRYPWAASLQRGGHTCTAELLAPKWAVTAAHCGPRGGDRLIVGRVDLRDENRGRVVAVAAGYLHERYESWRTGYDLALIQLAEPVSGIQFAEIGSAEPHTAVDVAGWGMTCATCATSPVLLFADLVLENAATCRSRYADFDSTMLCASAPGRDAAPGDSGGGLYAAAPDGRTLLVGIVSFGPSCTPTPDPDDIDPTCTGFYAEIASQAAGIRACIDGGL